MRLRLLPIFLLSASILDIESGFAEKASPKKIASKQEKKGQVTSVLEPEATPPAVSTPANALLEADFNKLPTYIKADNLLLKSHERVFMYSGNVEVKQGEMVITSDALEGNYDESNQIKDLTAKNNVTITKGEKIRAIGNNAFYEKNSETVTLTGSPELTQDESVLTADTIRIFLKEDRSTAEGQVRVKLAKQNEEGSKSGALDRFKR